MPTSTNNIGSLDFNPPQSHLKGTLSVFPKDGVLEYKLLNYHFLANFDLNFSNLLAKVSGSKGK